MTVVWSGAIWEGDTSISALEVYSEMQLIFGNAAAEAKRCRALGALLAVTSRYELSDQLNLWPLP